MGGDQATTGPGGPPDVPMSQSLPQPIPQKKTFFGWVSQTMSPSSSRTADPARLSTSAAPLAEPDDPVAPLPGTASGPTSEAIAGIGPARSPSVRRPRRDSSGLSHDEALNISRAGFSPPPGPPGSKAIPQTRKRSNSKYDKLGLMAAYSGGPSSF